MLSTLSNSQNVWRAGAGGQKKKTEIELGNEAFFERVSACNKCTHTYTQKIKMKVSAG